MNYKLINNNFLNATKWSVITEIIAKLITPITQMILARIISPEAFGVVATVTMVISFSDMFTDAGFQKYLVQHEFSSEQEKFNSANVAFWTNFVISIILWTCIILFREQIAIVVGNKGLGNVLAVSCFQILLTSFSSIQMALYRRDFDFKTLFLVRIVSIFVPFIVTIPLALLGFGYWSLIIGSIVMQIFNALILTIKSKWKPTIFYRVEILKEMISFSIWSLIEAISIWFTTWADMFIIGNSLNAYYLGIYKTSTSMVNSFMSIITASIVPVLFSALSRLQDDEEKFNNMYFKVQRIMSVFVFPLGIGIYCYSDLATEIMLGGGEWNEAIRVIGIWALTSCIMIIFSGLNSEVYRSKGRPKLSFLAQILHLIVLIPVCIISSKYGFWTLVYCRSFIRLEGVLVDYILMKYIIKFPMKKVFKNTSPIAISAILMGGVSYFLKFISGDYVWNFISIILCAIFYFAVLYAFPSMRKEMKNIISKILLKYIDNKNDLIKENIN